MQRYAYPTSTENEEEITRIELNKDVVIFDKPENNSWARLSIDVRGSSWLVAVCTTARFS